MKRKNIKFLSLFAYATFLFAFFATACFSSAPGTLKNIGNIGGISSNYADGVAVYPDGSFVISGYAFTYSFGTGDFINLFSKRFFIIHQSFDNGYKIHFLSPLYLTVMTDFKVGLYFNYTTEFKVCQ